MNEEVENNGKARYLLAEPKFQPNPSFHFENKQTSLFHDPQLYMELGKKLKPAAEPNLL